MPDTVPPPNPTPTPTPAPSSPIPPSGTPTSASASEVANIVAPEYVYPSNEATPAWARGKTAGDMLQLMQGLVESVGRGAAAAPAAAAPPVAGDDDYVTGATLRQAQNAPIAQVSPWLQQRADQQATVSYNISKRENSALFQKYEPEIIAVLQRVPRENWTLDVIENAVTFVKGK